MNQSFRILSKTTKLSKGFGKVNSKVSLSEAFSKKSSNFAQATSASSNSNYTSTFSKSSSFCTATQASNGGSIINNINRNKTSGVSNSSCSAFLEILTLGEDDDDR